MSQKRFRTREDHINSTSRNIADLILPNRNLSDSALIGQRGALANKYLTEAEGQALENKLTGHKVSAIEQALLDPRFKDLGIYGYSSFANPANAETLMKAGTEAALRGDEVEQAGLKTLAHKMALGLPINESQDPGLELMRRDAIKQAALTGDREQLEILKEVGAEIEQGDPGAVFATPEQSKMALALLGGRQFLTDEARAKSITAQQPGEVNLLEKKAGVQEAEIGVKGAEQKQIETMTPLQAALLKGKTSVQLANVEKIIQGIAFDEAESMQTQQKLIEEGKLAEARKNKVNVEMNSNKKIAAQKLLELKASTALEWAGVEKVISDIGNNDMISAMKSLLILEQTNTEKLQGEVEKQQIERIKELINNIKAHGKQQENESESRVDKTKAQITEIEVKTADDSTLTQAKTNLTNLKGEGELTDILLTEAKIEGEDADTTKTQVLTPRQADLLEAKTDYWRNKGEGELTDTMLTKSGGGTGTGKGKSQHDFRKTEAFQRYGRNVEDEGVAYTVTVPGTFWDSTRETHLWPDDDKKLREMMLPFPTDKEEKRKRMAEGKLFLSKAGNYDEASKEAILKSILGVKKN